MQWDAGEYAGFSASRPWLAIPENHAYINAEAEEQDADSVLAYYRKLVALRKEYPVIQEGAIEFLSRASSIPKAAGGRKASCPQ